MAFDTLQAAINEVKTDNVPKTIILEKDISEKITIAKSQNIVFDLQNYKILNNGNNAVITNNGTLAISNGTVESDVEYATINNNTGAILRVSGGNIISKGTRGAIYNKGGTVEISGSAYLSSTATGKPENATFDRATINNLEQGKLTITGGTIIGVNQEAVSNDSTSTLIIGVKDGNINTSSPVIIGNRYGMENTGTFNYYDGIIKGITGTISGTITETETNGQRITGTETTDGKTYVTEYLSITE